MGKNKLYLMLYLISLFGMLLYAHFSGLGKHDYLIGIFGVLALHFAILVLFGIIKLFLFIDKKLR